MPTATELDTWYGVQYKNGKLTNLDLGGNNLVGTIHQDLGNLSELKLLALYENELTGPIPSQLGSLANMNILLLGENELSGSIPPELGNLSNLTQLDLSDNKLTGSIPSELGSLTSLTNFSLHTNDLNGSIPHQLGSLAKLRFFWVHSNALTDSIPAQLGSLAELEQLKLDDNALTGTVPSELGRLSKLKYLHLDSNRLSGPLPDSLTHLSILTSLKFSNNDGLCAPSEVAFQTWLAKIILVDGPNCAPLQLDTPIPDTVFAVGVPIQPFVLPEAQGGVKPLRYALTPALPAGLSFSDVTRTISGTPTRSASPRPYTYAVTDSVGATKSQTFTVEVKGEPLTLSAIENKKYVVDDAIEAFTMPKASGGTVPYVYTLIPDPPTGLAYDDQTRILSGTPTAIMAPTEYTYSVTDNDGASASQRFFIEVTAKPLALPGVRSMEFTVATPIPGQVLPAAEGGASPYSYALSPNPPLGLEFDAVARTLSGTPTEISPPEVFEYSVTDANNARASRTFTIEVKKLPLSLPDLEPRLYVVGTPISDLELPQASGGAPPHTYTLSPSPPQGLDFDRELRTLSGTPTAVTPETQHTYTVKDADGDTTSSVFTIEVVSAALRLPEVSPQVFVAGTEVPGFLLPAATGGTRPHSYSLSPNPPSGLKFDSLARTLSGTPTTEQPPTDYTYAVMDAADSTVSTTFSIEVLKALGLPGIQDQRYRVDSAIEPLLLPNASGGRGPYVYDFAPLPPDGLVYDEADRMLTGTPSEVWPATTYTYSATDTDGRLVWTTFSMEVLAALALAAVPDQSYWVAEPATLILPAATGGQGPYQYALSPYPPVGLTFDPDERTLSGTPTEVSSPVDYTYTAVDADGFTAQQSFSIEVLAVLSLPEVSDQVYTVDEVITTLVLPAASGGRGPHHYDLFPDPPEGLTFDRNERTLSGTPTEVSVPADYTYTAIDADSSIAEKTFTIEVLAALGLARVQDQFYSVDEPIAPLVLPAATGGRPPYVYELIPDPPPALTYDATSRTLSGTPATVMPGATFEHTAVDAEGTKVSVEFTIEVGASAALIRDRAALIALYESTGGADWTDDTNWLNPPAEVVTFTEQQLNAWYGVTVTGGCVVALELPQNNLQGTLPDALGSLSCLRRLTLHHNNLAGSLPDSLGHLGRLHALLLHDNQLTGSIPAALQALDSLEQLHLHNNALEGALPAALANMSALQELWVHGNDLTGTIPSALGRLRNLRGLLVNNNQISGPVPSELGDLAQLTDLWLNDNALTGIIPPQLGQLNSLRGLLLSGNELIGPIPAELGNLALLEDLWLQSNALTGTIPVSLGRLDRLRSLLLHENGLTGTIPDALAALESLQSMQLQQNMLEGAIPPALGLLTHLERLQLEGNRLTGTVPDSLGNMTSLAYLYVHDNTLTGTLPVSLSKLTSMKELFFGGPHQDVCAPDDDAFLAWMASLDAVKGPKCGDIALFFATPVPDQHYTVGEAIESLVLPPAGGGTAPYAYSLHPMLPSGLIYDALARTVRGTPTEPLPQTVYTYAAVDEGGHSEALRFSITVQPDPATVVVLHGTHPNPFSETTQVELSLAQDAQVSVQVYDLLGRRVLQRAARTMNAGARQRIPITLSAMVPGVYFYRVVAVTRRQTAVRTGRMTMLR